jgi:PAS domain-containing protein
MHDASSKKTDDAYPFWFLLDGSSTCIALLDLQLHVIGGNAGFAEVFGLEVGTLPGRKIIELVQPRKPGNNGDFSDE